MSTPSETMSTKPGSEAQKISKEEFVTFTATHVILTRFTKPLSSAQRNKLRIKSAKSAHEVMNLAVLFFCQAHFREDPETNVDRLVKLWQQNTKKDRMELCEKVVQITKRQKMIEAYKAQNPEDSSTNPEQQVQQVQQMQQVQPNTTPNSDTNDGTEDSTVVSSTIES